MIGIEQQKKTRYAAIAIAEWMDAKKVEVRPGYGHYRMDPSFFEALFPNVQHFAKSARAAPCRNSVKSNTHTAIGAVLDDVTIRFFILAGVTGLAPAEIVEL